MTALPLILTVFVACAVEAIEALTIVLAAGLTREWRSTFQGMALALVVLAIFGLQWLRKAILRATGYKSLHDEASAYLREVAAAEAAATTMASTTRATAIPWNVERHSRVRPDASTIVSASVASTAQATKTVRMRGSEFTLSP